ncbi:hypothetical protein FQN57_002168 [Myotisia sp. PD_48]|nr:hypothetical protein FQN57_002168 [Myotisia sp. PD_48]
MVGRPKRRKLNTGESCDLVPIHKLEWHGFCEIESEPALFNSILSGFGVKGVKVQEVFSLDDEMLALLPQPLYGLIFLFRWQEDDPSKQEQSCPPGVWFANQTVNNACATVALLNIINNVDGIELGPELQSFKEFTRDFTPALRGDAIANFEFVKRIHNSFARGNDILNLDLQFKDEATARKKKSTKGQADDEWEAGFHFIAFVKAKDRVWKFDGLERQPQMIGECQGNDWLGLATPEIQSRMAEYTEDQIEFSILSLSKDPMDTHISNLASNVKSIRALNHQGPCSGVSSPATKNSHVCLDDGILDGPDPTYGLTQEILDNTVVPEDVVLRCKTGDAEGLAEDKQRISNQQKTLRLAIKEEQQARAAEKEYVDSRVFDYEPAVRRWVQILAQKKMLQFGHNYRERLENEGFPAHWVHSAISYRQLKKCIKKVRAELLELGLGPDVLNQFWATESQLDGDDGEEDEALSRVGFYYSFQQTECTSSSSVAPMLTFAMGPGISLKCQLLPCPTTGSTTTPLPLLLLQSPPSTEPPPLASDTIAKDLMPSSATTHFAGVNYKTQFDICSENSQKSIQIPLSADSEFFRILRKGLSKLEQLQEQQKTELEDQIVLLHRSMVKVADTSSGRKHPSLYAWREIFRLYMDMQVFFSTGEIDCGERSSETAHKQLQKFQYELMKTNHSKKLKKEGRHALESFLKINMAILQNLKFHEINGLAFTKILKKFDKRTALRARSAFTQKGPLSAQFVARTVCQAISEQILGVIPQLEDYLCPICFSIAFKPIRLRCNHIFCIRCLVIMQRAQQNQCAMCRAEVVMEANSDNLDKKMLTFLMATFPKESKAKQKESERAASLELYGDSYDTCSVM